MIARGVIFACLVLAMSVGRWTIGRAAEDPGEGLYRSNCSRCHGPEGRGAQGPNLIPFNLSYEQALDAIRHPVCDMPSFSESDLSDADVAQIVGFLKTIKN